MGLKREGARRAMRGGLLSSTVYVGALSSATAEFSGNGYARISAPTSAFTAQSDGSTQNANALEFPLPTGTLPAPTHAGIWTAATGGTLLWTMDLDGNPVAPPVGAMFGFDAGELTIGFTATGTKVTAAGARECLNNGLLSGNRLIGLHSAQPASATQHRIDSTSVAQSFWVEVAGVNPHAMRNIADINFGAQATDVPDVMWVSISTSAGVMLWSDALDNDPADPEIGDTLILRANDVMVSIPID